MHGWRTARYQVTRREAFANDVAQPTGSDSRESARDQCNLVQLIRRHPMRPKLDERLGLIDEPKACLQLRCVGGGFRHDQPTK